MQEQLAAKSVRATANAVFEELPDGGLALLNSSTQNHFRLNPVGATMWAALIAQGSVGAAAQALIEAFAVEPDRLWQDLAEFIEQLELRGLVEVVGD